MFFKTSNPVFTPYLWKHSYGTKKMTLRGVLLKSMYSLFLVTMAAWYVWNMVKRGENVKFYIYGGMLVAIFFSVLTSYKKRWSPITVPLYALSKGFFLGGISSFADNKFNGLPTQAVKVSILSFFVMLLLYKLNIIKVTHQFRSVIYSSIATIMTLYFISFILRLFGLHLGFVYGSKGYSILFTFISASVASFSLILDFDYIDRKIHKAPKYMEWVATWGILVSLIWLYIEVLRWMKKLATRF